MSATFQSIYDDLTKVTEQLETAGTQLRELDCNERTMHEALGTAHQLVAELLVEVDYKVKIAAVKNGDAVSRDDLVAVVLGHALLPYREIEKWSDFQLTDLIQGSL